MEVLDRMPWAAKDSVFRKLAEIAEVSNMSKDDRIKYDSALRHYRDTLSVLQGAKDSGRREGREEGREVGRKEGREVGRKEGREVGRKEGREVGRKEVAKKMKSAGIPITQIVEFTGLSAQDIELL